MKRYQYSHLLARIKWLRPQQDRDQHLNCRGGRVPPSRVSAPIEI